MTARIALFDLGNVVVDWQPVRLYKDIFASETRARDFLSTVCTMDWHTEHDRGVPMALNAQKRIAEYPHYADEIHAWRARWLDMFEGYVPGVPQIMAELEEARIALYGLSNIPAEVAEETFDAFPMIRIFRDVIVSGAEKCVKPDPRIYQIALARMGHPDPDTVLFIDDRQTNIDAAAALGFRTHQFQNAAGLRRALRQEKLL